MHFKKYVAEFLGTLTLVLFGCGTAVVCGGYTGGTGGGYLGVVAIALAFGLAIVAAAYAIGDISGCHVNPAVSLAVLINGGMSGLDFVGYVIAQILGAIGGSAILFAIVQCTGGYLDGSGANGYGAASAVGLNMGGAIIVEIVLTFFFVMTILGVTRNGKTSHMAGIVIGLTLVLVHLIGIPLTGTSVNPARSISAAIFGGTESLKQLWVFIVAPLVGAVLAALVHKVLFPKKPKIEEK